MKPLLKEFSIPKQGNGALRRLKRLWLFILCLFLLTLGCINQPVEKGLPETAEKGELPVGEENYYTHSMLGEHVGYTHYRTKKKTIFKLTKKRYVFNNSIE